MIIKDGSFDLIINGYQKDVLSFGVSFGFGMKVLV